MTYNFKAIANEITERGINLFGNEDDWFKGSMALSNLGDAGKEIFHAISSLSPLYNYKDSDYQFRYATRTNTKIGIATFLQMAKNVGIDISRFKVNGDNVPDIRLLKPTPPPTPPSYIPKEYLIKCFSYRSKFVEFLCGLFDIKTIERVAADYYLGATKSRDVIFWQVDVEKRIRTGKIMSYDSETGHRTHNSGATNWIHSLLKKQGLIDGEFNLQQCLFGEHLLKKYPGKVVAMVESEKTAVIASAVFPKYVWLATGGKYGINADKMNVLAGRKVILFPDTDTTGETYNYWKEKATELTYCRCVVSDILELNATNAERIKKIDIADWLCKELETEPQRISEVMTEQEQILADMIKTNATVRLLVEVFDLQIVEDAKVIPDSEFYFATHGRKRKAKETCVSKHKLYS
ncbi:DUF6371 domain-containing protein [Prevotella sp. tf2-5]|uniref:DUF6371 domain-containing protein n=1 Tax=Prevotella sp. tf2-5 TaxID=1761889 RepID=UPI0008F0572A|nr:DUF6371 domain-containing protein [Prevotella sp. tf2-5]SFO58423.1 Primase C terminal 2 (PriCT-2) [Prevotella sp. tf2-5]